MMINFLSELKNNGVLTTGTKNGNEYWHLAAPCKIEISESVSKKLKDNYEPDKEKGGVFVANPLRKGDETCLLIEDVIYLTNISDSPRDSYRPDSDELQSALNYTLNNPMQKTLPIRFHTHPTHSSDPFYEMVNYVFQSNTSGADQIVSDYPVKVGEINLLMPRSIVLCNGRLQNRMFIGFYNGLIAPIEFDTHRREKVQEALENITDKISEWADKGNNKMWLAFAVIGLIILTVRYNKFAIPLLSVLALMIPTMINGQNNEPEYFAQVTKGKVVISIP